METRALSALGFVVAVALGLFGLACAIYPLWLVLNDLLSGRPFGVTFGNDRVFGVGMLLFFVVVGCGVFYIFVGSVFQRVRVSVELLELWGLWGQYRRWDLTQFARVSDAGIAQCVDEDSLFGRSLSETPTYDIDVWWSGSKYNEPRLQVMRRVDAVLVEQIEWFIRGAGNRSEVCAALLSELTRLHPGFRVRPDVYIYCGLPVKFPFSPR